jgi:chitodextrinase
LSWTAATDNVGVTGYEVYRGSTMLTTVTGTTFQATGLTQGTAYTFSVKTRDAAGNTSVGVTVNATTITSSDTTAPNDVTGLSATPGQTTVALSWTASNSGDVAGYNVYSGATKLNTGFVTGTTYNVTGLTAATAYTFRVTAVDASNNESTGATVDVTTTMASGGEGTDFVVDSFTRADSTTLGTTETGQAWTQHADVTYGIVGNQAYQSVQVQGGAPRYRKIASIEVPTNHFSVEAKFPVLETAVQGNEALHFRWVSPTDTVMVFKQSGKWKIAKFIASTFTELKACTAIPANGDHIRVENLPDGMINVYINGVLDSTVTDTALLNATNKVGIACETNVSRFDDFKVVTY